MAKTVYEKALEMHEKNQGKIGIVPKVKVTNKEELSLAYSPGVAEPCRAIQKNPEDSYKYTSRGNIVAVITDGTAVLGLGDIGPEAAMPVMEGKSILLKEFAGIDSFPLAVNTKDPQEIINIVKALEPSFGGINLEDIRAPKCVEIERALKKEMNIPVFHDDQHGTAIVTTAALINSCRLTGKKVEDLNVLLSGTGAAGSSIARMLKDLGVKNVYAWNSKGSVRNGVEYKFVVQELLDEKIVTPWEGEDSREAMMPEMDVFVGVSASGLFKKDLLKLMKKDAFVFAMANPTPEFMDEGDDIQKVLKELKEAGIKIIGTGRSDIPNQVNNVLAFPGIFRGALDAKATSITEGMKLAAAEAIAYHLEDKDLSDDHIIPSPFDMEVPKKVAEGVKACAIKEGVIRK